MPDFAVKFADAAVDEETTIRSMSYLEIAGYAARFESWVWDGITGSTLIFDEADVGSLSDEEITKLSFDAVEHDGKSFTVSRSNDRFAYVNFNFRS